MLRYIEKARTILVEHPDLDEQIKELAVIRRFRRGEHIDSTSEMRHLSMYITKGCARLYFLKNGKEHTYSVAFDGEFITVFHSLLDNPAASTRIEFIEPTTVVVTPMDKIHSILKAAPPDIFGSFAEVFLLSLYSHNRSLEERLILFQTGSAVERYRWLLARYPEINKRLNATQIASLLGMTRETLYRIRSGKYRQS
ncbi:MAG: Crp/Fnr family transcriptional regulator [Paramuribaculum sp.]|nr:Crp/Fnr family transcriptional regulator [Paramuribaculum sp.]